LKNNKYSTDLQLSSVFVRGSLELLSHHCLVIIPIETDKKQTPPHCGCTKSMEIFLERGKKMKHFDGLYVQRAEKKHTRYIEIDE